MEIEAKFRLLDPSVADLRRLKEIYSQAGYAVTDNVDPIHIVDTYFDRADHALRKAGAALRVRVQNGEVLLTYKRTVAQEGALHSRVELEAEPTPDHFRRVYDELDKLDLPLVGDTLRDMPSIKLEDALKAWGIVPFLEIRAERFKFDVGQGDRTAAFVVLDQVRFQHGAKEGGYSGIEIEAAGDENARMVVALSEILEAEWGEGIQGQGISKYEFALESLGMDR